MRRYHHISQAERRKRKVNLRPSKLHIVIKVLVVVAVIMIALMAARSFLNTGDKPAEIQPLRSLNVPENVSNSSSRLVSEGRTNSEVSETGTSVNTRFELCGAVRINCVVDGDTLWVEGVKIRVADIDTPEISQPQCDSEKALGQKATRRFLSLVNEGAFRLEMIGSRDEDRFGRKLRVLVRNGGSIGNQLVEEGLARTWTGKREPWC